MVTRFDNAYVLNVMADDHPGIVAAVTAAVEEFDGNIDACSQTVLSGYFTLIMVVSMPEPVDPQQLCERVRGGQGRQKPPGFQVSARAFVPPADEPAGQERGRFVITAFGEDRPGIVRRFSQYLAGKDVNIIDLYGDRSGDRFVLISQVELPPRWDIQMLQADLEEIGKEEGFTVRLQHENVFVATNQLRGPQLRRRLAKPAFPAGG